MFSQKKIIVFGILAGILYYLLDSLIDFILYKEIRLIDSLILQMPSEEIISRIIALIIIITIIIVFLAWNRYKLKADKMDIPGEQTDIVSNGMNPALLSAILNQCKVSLHIIVGFADLLNKKDLDSKTRELYSKYIYDNSTPSLQLMDNISDLLAIESGQISIKKDTCYLNRLFEEIFLEYNCKKTQNYNEEIAPDLLRSGNTEELVIRIDCKRLKQILLNLITNSCVFSNLSKIEVGYIIEEKFLKFFINDNVKTLRISNLDALLTKHNDSNTIQSQSLMIAALRFKIAQKLVNILGGELWSSPIGEDLAATHFTIPLEIIDQPKEQDLQDKQITVPSWDQYHILIVEDIKLNYIYLSALLKPTKVQITWAKNGKEAVELTKKPYDFNVVLMDILMPEMDGYETAKLIKEKNKDLPIIAQTAYSLESESEETIVNFDEILTKPICSYELFRMLSKFLDQ